MSYRHRRYDDLSVSILEHLDEKIEELIAEGLSYEEAERVTHREFGDVAVVEENSREIWQGPIESVLSDIRQALFKLGGSARIAVSVVLTMALGIGACTAIFTLVHTISLRPLPVSDPQSLYRIGDTGDPLANDRIGFPGEDGDFYLFSYILYQHLRSSIPELGQLAAMGVGHESVAMQHGTLTLNEDVEYVSGNYFSTLGAAPYMGRTLTDADDIIGAPPVAVIRYQVWQKDFGGDPAVIGSTVILQSHPVRIVGVAAQEFFGEQVVSNPPAFWVPIALQPLLSKYWAVLHPEENCFFLVGRIRHGVEIDALQRRISAELRQWLSTQSAYTTEINRPRIAKQHVVLTPVSTGIRGYFYQSTRLNLYLLLGFSIVILLIACINAANLLLIKGEKQRVDTIMRIALGASRFRVIQKAVAESVVLGCIGGLIGLVVSYATAHIILRLAVMDSPYSPIQAAPSLPVTGFTLLVAVVAGTFFGIVPAWITSGNGSLWVSVTRKILVFTQACLSTALIVTAGLLMASLWKMEHEFFGVELRDRYVVHFNVSGSGYRPDQLASLYSALQQQLQAVPGVRSVGFSLCAPLDGFEGTTLHMKIHFQDANRNGGSLGKAALNRVSPGFFDVAGGRILKGRDFRESDTAVSQPVAIISEAFAKKFFPDEDPIGHRFAHGESASYQIVGIAADAKYLEARGDIVPTYFRPMLQWQPDLRDPVDEEFETVSAYVNSAVLYMNGPSEHLETDVREAIRRVNPQLPIRSIRSFDSLVHISFRHERTIAYITTLFGMMALLLTVAGFYNVARYQRETSEQPTGMRTLYRLILSGIALGIPIAFLCAHFIEVQLHIVIPHVWSGLMIAFVLLMGYVFAEYIMSHRKRFIASESPLRQSMRSSNFNQ
jgi:macrolide transport system ATP-binding/permease protein